MKPIILFLAITLSATACATNEPKMMTEKAFATEMAEKHGFEAKQITAYLDQARHKDSIVKAMDRPAEAKPWHKYRNIFLQKDRIEEGVDFFNKHEKVLKRAESELGVDPYIITAIIGVETKYGQNTGSFRVIDALKTLGFGYPRRAEFFRGQLEAFFLMCREEGIDPLKPKGSYAGAMGMPQFIPSSFRSYAIDFDGDNKRDLWHNTADVIGSVANYFKMHGWKSGQPVTRKLDIPPKGLEAGSRRGQKPNYTLDQLKSAGILLVNNDSGIDMASLVKLQQESSSDYWLGFNNFYVITRYNHSNLYAMAVYQLSEAIRTSRIGQ